MAKLNHVLFGQAKGKVGGMVLQRYEGMNIAREKPISVKNPQSTKQTEQRAKFKLSSQILAQFKEVISVRLSNVSIYERLRRANGLNAIISAITTTNPSTPSALVLSVVDAINAKSVSGIDAPTLTNDSTKFNLTAGNGKVVSYVHCAYNTDGTLMNKVAETFTSSGTVKEIPFIAGATSQVVMAVTAEATTETGRAIISNLENTTGNTFQISITRGVASGDLLISNMASVVE